MNFTWLGSAYDTDDVPYRLTTLVQIVGALILAAGVPEATDGGNFAAITVGYVVMRLAMVTQWLRRPAPTRPTGAARCVCRRHRHPPGLLRCACSCPRAWPASWSWPRPSWPSPSRRAATPTTWHPRHIGERYGLFTLIVLKSGTASTLAIQSALEEDAALADLATTAGRAADRVRDVVAVLRQGAGPPTSRAGIVWGYGHYLVFGSAAAVGAGLAVNVDFLTHHQAAVGPGGRRRSIPVALFLVAGRRSCDHHLGWHSAGARHCSAGPGLHPHRRAHPGHRPGGGHDRRLPGHPAPPGGLEAA